MHVDGNFKIRRGPFDPSLGLSDEKIATKDMMILRFLQCHHGQVRGEECSQSYVHVMDPALGSRSTLLSHHIISQHISHELNVLHHPLNLPDWAPNRPLMGDAFRGSL